MFSSVIGLAVFSLGMHVVGEKIVDNVPALQDFCRGKTKVNTVNILSESLIGNVGKKFDELLDKKLKEVGDPAPETRETEIIS